MRLKLQLPAKAGQFRISECEAAQLFTLPASDFQAFLNWPQKEKCRDIQPPYYGEEGKRIYRGVLILGEGLEDGIFAYDAGEHFAYLPGARAVVDSVLEQAVEKIIREGTENTNEGNWCYYFSELYEQMGLVIEEGNGFDAMLLEKLEQRPEAAEVTLTDECFDVCYYLDYCKNLAPEQPARSLSAERKEEIISGILNYMAEYFDGRSLYDILHNTLGIRNDEIGCLGFALHDEYVNEQLEVDLAERLRHTGGKKQYGYLKAPLKAVVDEIVDELAKDPCVAAAYALWHELREDVLRTYRDDLPPRLPLSQQKEFKRIKNIVIEEAVKLGARQQVFHPDDQQDGVSAATPGDPSLPELTQPDDDCGDPVESPPEAPPEKSGSAKAHMEWSKEYRLARRCLFGDKNQPQDFEQAFSLFQEEAQKGNALAMCDLGRMLADGLGQEIDIQAAHVWYRKALAAFHAVEEQKKNRYAEYRIGKLYAAGLGCEQDYGDAARWFQLSADKGYKYAQYSLAGLFRRRQGVEQDDARALELYTASAQQYFPYAAYELGKMYRDGIGCEKDAEASEQWYKQAFAGFLELEQQSHDDKLQYRIGWLFLYGVGTGKDEAAAREWFERASKLGNPHAQYQLARMILDAPSSTPEQTAQALEWLTKAAEAGQDCAQYAFGKIYREGQEIEKDIQQAVELFTLAAEQGNSFAAFALGKLYLSGDAGLPIDPPSALKWLTFSAELGNQFAQYRLGKLLLQGEEVPKDTEAAIRWLTAAAEQGNQYAQYALGKLYLLGKEVPKDKSNAIKWFQLAADQGNEYAKYFLEHMDDRLGQPPAAAVISLLHHLANIFQEQSQPPSDGIRVAVDRKLLRKIKAKKIAQGHKADDHEPEMKF